MLLSAVCGYHNMSYIKWKKELHALQLGCLQYPLYYISLFLMPSPSEFDFGAVDATPFGKVMKVVKLTICYNEFGL